MSFDGINDQLKKRLRAIGFQESAETFDFDNASPNEFENTFILTPVAGNMEDEGETLVDRFYDEQVWQIKIAFAKSAHNDIGQREAISRRTVDVIKDLDNPSNWEGVTSGAREQRYESWELIEMDDYFLLVINMRIIDQVNY